MNQRKASIATATNILTSDALDDVLDDAGWPSADRTIDAGQVTMTRWGADGVEALTAMFEIEETELGFLAEGRDGKIVFESLSHRLSTPHTTSQATFSDASGAALPYDAVQELDPWRDIYNRFEADVITYAVQGLAVLWTLTGETPVVNPGASLVFWAQYPTPDAAREAIGVDAWTTPVASTDYVANSDSGGGGTDLTASVAIAVSKFEKSMKMTFTNNAAVPAYMTTMQARGTAVYRNDPIRVADEDTTSQTSYGKRTYPLRGKFYPTTTRARSFCEFGVSRFKDPMAVLAMGYDPAQSDDHMTQALTRDISDRITVVGSGTGQSGAGLGISDDFFIEAETWRWDLSGYRVRYDLGYAPSQDYWVLGVSLLGIDTRLTV